MAQGMGTWKVARFLVLTGRRTVPSFITFKTPCLPWFSAFLLFFFSKKSFLEQTGMQERREKAVYPLQLGTS